MAAVKEPSANAAGAKRKTISVDTTQKTKKTKLNGTGDQPQKSKRKPQETTKDKQDKSKHLRKTKLAAPAVDSTSQVDEHDEDQNNLLDAVEEGLNEAASQQVAVHPQRAHAVSTANGQNSREAHAKAKQLARERKAAKPLAEQLARTKKIWERLRRKSHVPKPERKELVTELFEIITGRCKDFVLKHDSVRVVQTAIKYATPEQKRQIAKELAGSYCQLAESKYAKFLIGKLLVQGDDEIRDTVLPEFFGHVRRLIKHPEAAWIVDDVYRGVATKQQKAIMLREWYGAEFALASTASKDAVESDLRTILEAEPSRRQPIMRSLHELINHLIQKKSTGFTMLHDAMLQYFLNTKPGTEEVTDFLELVRSDEEGDLLKNLAFTKSGARLVCLVLAYSNAKERKLILRVYKDVISMLATDSYGHAIILTAYEVIDDTVLTAKSILPELLSKESEKQTQNVVHYAGDLNARTALLYCLQGRSKALFPPSHKCDLELLAEIDVARAGTSKKDPETRRKELVKAVSPYLIKAIEVSAYDLAQTAFGCQLIVEVMFGAEGDKTAAISALAQAVATDLDGPMSDESSTGAVPIHSARTPHGAKMLKSLVAGGRFDHKTKSIIPVEPPLNFAEYLFPAIKPHLLSFLIHGPYVISAVLESPGFKHRAEVLAMIKKNKAAIQKAATEETLEQKTLREAAQDVEGTHDKQDNKSGRQKGTKKKPAAVGNRGCALLLDLV